MSTAHRATVEAIWRAGVLAVQPRSCVPRFFHHRVQQGDPRFDFSRYERLLVVGAGKAGSAMTAALEETLVQLGVDLNRLDGWVNVPNETIVPVRKIHLHPSRPLGTNEPTDQALFGAERILELVSSAGPEDLLFCLISGGGSALLPLPAEGISLAEKQQVVRLLHRCGATIQEMNAVRKHISRIKGGRLAEQFTGRLCLTLIISDVIGDPLDVIASGPTAPDPTTFADAWAVLEKYRLVEQVPGSVREHLQRGLRGEVSETPKTIARDAHGETRVFHFILASNRDALESAAQQAARQGFETWSLGPYIQGETRTVAEELARQTQTWRQNITRPLVVLSGGETTVTLPPEHGKGGRNQEFALAFLHQLSDIGLEGITLLSAGTDGEDGPTDAAGAFVDMETWQRARRLGLDIVDYLHRHDAYTFFEAVQALFKPGFTQTNVMDLRVLLLEPSSSR